MRNVIFLKKRPGSQIQWRHEITRFFRFGIVGVSATLVDFAILTALKYFFGWPTLLANLISYSCGTLNSFMLNRSWVFPEARSDRSLRQLFRFIAINVVGLVLNMTLLLLLEMVFGNLLPNPAYAFIPAKIGATGLVFLWNFFANRYWTFNRAAPVSIPLPAPKPVETEQTAA